MNFGDRCFLWFLYYLLDDEIRLVIINSPPIKSERGNRQRHGEIEKVVVAVAVLESQF